MTLRWSALALWILAGSLPAAPVTASELHTAILPLFKTRCVRCHGPNKPKAGLNLSTAGAVARGSENGAVVAAKDLEKSAIWQRISADEMPPDKPLSAEEKQLVKAWIAGGAEGLPKTPEGSEGAHWAFARLQSPVVPDVKDSLVIRTRVDRFLQNALEAQQLSLGNEADRSTLQRRVAFILTGLPPMPEEVDEFLHDDRADAYDRMVERYLASPRYGEHWGKHWLDAVGYADTNGYFGRESERPHAWRYRDYVVDSFNADKPLDRFIREQLAGDELAGVMRGAAMTPAQRELLIATHLLRNGPDGTDDSAPSPEAQRIDRYAALEAAEQVVYTSLLGLSIKCARCHDHKFEPITQREYYEAQSIFYPAFNPTQWVIPKQRVVNAATTEEKTAWESKQRDVESRLAVLRTELRDWVSKNREHGRDLFHDDFSERAAWMQAPANAPPANVESGALTVASSVDSWIATPQPVEWAPAEVGGVVQLTFDLVADKARPEDEACQYFGYVLSATRFEGSEPGTGGNLFFDGRRMGSAQLYWLRPGANRYEGIGPLGEAKYEPGRTYGVRITNIGEGKLRLEHLVDFNVEGKPYVLPREQLPAGPFAFYRYPGRNYVVDNLSIESFPPPKHYAGNILFQDFGNAPVAELWSAAAPGDELPPAPVLIDKVEAGKNGADRKGTRLRIVVGGQAESWLCTKKSFDWTPDVVGQSIQATFDLVANQVELPAGGMSPAAPHVAYYLGAQNFGSRRVNAPGNVLIDGGVPRPTHVYRNYPATQKAEPLGSLRTQPGHNFGVRVTNIGDGKFHLHHVVDFVPDGAPLTLTAADLPDGAFGFYFGADRSFVVDKVVVAEGEFAKHDTPGAGQRAEQFAARLAEFTAEVKKLEQQRVAAPGIEVAWVTDMAPQPPQVFLLKRGLYGEHGDAVTPAGLSALTDADNAFDVRPPEGSASTGRRLALANWMLKPGSRPAALVARMRANWIWLHHFGTGLSSTPENFGVSGATPSNPDLLEYLSAELIHSDWSVKQIHRLILHSAAFRQSSAPRAEGIAADPDNRLLWRYPLQRLDAESVRDAIFAASGELGTTFGGPPQMLEGVDGHGSKGEVSPQESNGGAGRRTLYVQRRRNVLPTFLQLFDFPSIAATCAERSHSTVALQSLAQLNSSFYRRRATAMADRLIREAADESAQVNRAFLLASGRAPTGDELKDSLDFLRDQRATYGTAADAPRKAMTDFCQMLFASNPFLYLE